MAPPRKTFRAYDQNQQLLLPPDLAEWIPVGHLARLVSDLVDNVLDLSAIYAAYVEERGAPPVRICDRDLQLKAAGEGSPRAGALPLPDRRPAAGPLDHQ